MNSMWGNAVIVACVMVIVTVATVSLATENEHTNWFQAMTNRLMQMDDVLLEIPEERNKRMMSLHSGIHH